MQISRVKPVDDASAGFVEGYGAGVYRPIAAERPLIEPERSRGSVVAGLAHERAAGRCEALRLVAAEIIFLRSEILPVRRNLRAARIDLDGIVAHAGIAGLTQQLLNDGFRALVLAFAELVMTDLAVGIDDIQGGPIVVAECVPYPVVAVDRDGVLDTKHLERRTNVFDVLLEPELGSVHADHHQSLILVLLGPCTNVRFCTLPVDAGVSPEVDDEDLPAQGFRRQWLRIEPGGGAGERGQGALDR